MRNILLILLLCTCAVAGAQKQTAPFLLEIGQGQKLAWEGELAAGTPLSTLDWAWSAQNACFVEPRKEFYTGNNVFYRTEIPKYSTMVIRLTPKDKNDNISLYAYSGSGESLPPELYGCVSCEADFQMDRHVIGRKRPGYVRQVELRAVNRPYPITIGVVGANGLSTGAYTLEISVVRNR